MRYEKPQVRLLSCAIDAIQSTLVKNIPSNPDTGMVFHTNSAYEADE